jgi:hypothetical protein
MGEAKVSAAEIGRAELLEVLGNGGTFRDVVLRFRQRYPDIGERAIDRLLQRERRAGVVESVARRWRRVEGRNDE